MNRDEILAMARKASATGCGDELTGDAIERFAALVAEHEREECAGICARFGERGMNPHECAAAIRARGL